MEMPKKMRYLTYMNLSHLDITSFIHSINKYLREPTRCWELKSQNPKPISEDNVQKVFVVYVYFQKLSSLHAKDVIEDNNSTSAYTGHIPTHKGPSAAANKPTISQLFCLSLAPATQILSQNPKFPSLSPKTRAHPALFLSPHLHPAEEKRVWTLADHFSMTHSLPGT